MDELPDIDPALRVLRQAFVAHGFDLRLVGGWVRARLKREEADDIDLCTDANPDEQKAVYRACGIRYFETGLKHGTLSVKPAGELYPGAIYEITTLRTESNHDGRHCEVSYTRDWEADLARRDLTINAMAMTFDGELIDPFGGADDLLLGRVRFVGDADRRLREDYLRILRFFRFYARYGGAIDDASWDAIQANAGGLRTISKERVWQEMPKIISGPRGPAMMAAMQHLGVGAAIDLPWGSNMRLAEAGDHTRNPVTLLTAYLGDTADHTLATWRASTAERQLARFLMERMATPLTRARAKALLAIDRVPLQHVQELARVQGNGALADFLFLWQVPRCPVTGLDLIEMGVAKGPGLGETLDRVKQAWADSDYELDKEALLIMEEWS